MSPNDLAITKMEIELPHQHRHRLYVDRDYTALVSGSMVPVPGLTSVFIYPQLSISISTVPAHFQASSRGTPEQSFFFTFTSYFWFQHRSCFVISNMEKCESKKKYCAGAALHAAQLRDDWEES